MRVVLRLAAHELRARWLGWAVLALIVGLAGGVVLTAAAGARRTDSAYPRFLTAYRASDVLVGPAAGWAATTTRWPGCRAWRRSPRSWVCRRCRWAQAGS